MPQLNPTPWLATLIFTWLVFLIIVPPKIMSYMFPNGLILKNKKDSMTGTWNWPWY